MVNERVSDESELKMFLHERESARKWPQLASYVAEINPGTIQNDTCLNMLSIS